MVDTSSINSLPLYRQILFHTGIFLVFFPPELPENLLHGPLCA